MKSFQSDPKPCKLMWFKPTGEHQPLHHVQYGDVFGNGFLVCSQHYSKNISVSKVSNSCMSFSENIKL